MLKDENIELNKYYSHEVSSIRDAFLINSRLHNIDGGGEYEKELEFHNEIIAKPTIDNMNKLKVYYFIKLNQVMRIQSDDIKYRKIHDFSSREKNVLFFNNDEYFFHTIKVLYLFMNEDMLNFLGDLFQLEFNKLKKDEKENNGANENNIKKFFTVKSDNIKNILTNPKNLTKIFEDYDNENILSLIEDNETLFFIVKTPTMSVGNEEFLTPILCYSKDKAFFIKNTVENFAKVSKNIQVIEAGLTSKNSYVTWDNNAVFIKELPILEHLNSLFNENMGDSLVEFLSKYKYNYRGINSIVDTYESGMNVRQFLIDYTVFFNEVNLRELLKDFSHNYEDEYSKFEEFFYRYKNLNKNPQFQLFTEFLLYSSFSLKDNSDSFKYFKIIVKNFDVISPAPPGFSLTFDTSTYELELKEWRTKIENNFIRLTKKFYNGSYSFDMPLEWQLEL